MNQPRPISPARGVAAALTLTLGAFALTATLTGPFAGRRLVTSPPPEPGGLGVHVAFQLADCPSTLDFLEIQDHPTLAGSVALSSLVFLGDAREVSAATRALAPIAERRPLRPASAYTRRALRALGFARTPFFFVEDAVGAVRFAAPVPTDPRQLRALHASLLALADLEAHRRVGAT
jgi:hypothetical protein